MKIKEIKKVPKDKIGHLNKNGVKLEPAEEATFEYLLLFGFDIEVIIPTSIKGVSNPDVLISGGIWEVKTPTSFNNQTIVNRFREAASQASKIIFDLRFVKKHAEEVERQISTMFREDGRVRRLIIITKNGELLDNVK